MPVPHLTEKDRENLTELQQSLIDRVFDCWRYHEIPLQYGAATGPYNKSAKKQGLTMRTLIDSVTLLGYIRKMQTSRGGYFLIPYNVWDKLPVYKQDTWLHPTKRKEAHCAELDAGRKVRLLKEERDEPRYNAIGKKVDPAQDVPKNNPTISVDPKAIKAALIESVASSSSGLLDSVEGKSDAQPRRPIGTNFG